MGYYSGKGIDDGRLSEFNEATSFTADGLDEMIDSLPDFDELCKEALKEAAPIMEREMKKSCGAVIEHEGDSELVESIKANEPKRTKDGDAWIVSITPHGNTKKVGYYKESYTGGNGHKRYYRRRKYPVSNMLKAIWKEFGIPGRQAPCPFLQAARNSAEPEVIKKIQEVFNRKVGAE